MRALATAAALSLLAAPIPALAQDREIEDSTAEIARTLGDPGTQAAMADGMAAASEAMLDIPLAPMARAIARAAGEDPEAVDPRLTLRDVSPGAQAVPDRVRAQMPAMMGAMADMAGGMGAMIPAMKDIAARMAGAIAQAQARVHGAY